VDGRRSGVKVESYASGVTRVEAQYLFAKEAIEIHDDYWNGTSKVRVVEKRGIDERHGRWTAYYQNGQKALEGEYQHDVPTGTFVWWHPNGRKAIQGNYEDGRQSGSWAWWYPSGQVQIRGNYLAGQLFGTWTWRKEDGTIAQAQRYDAHGQPSHSKALTDTVVSIPDPQKSSIEPAVPMPPRTASRAADRILK
jgi:antitoxin component YwqK of YwqJK toxin-antitoxin module